MINFDDGPPPPDRKAPKVFVKMPKPGSFLILAHACSTVGVVVHELPTLEKIRELFKCEALDTIRLRGPFEGFVMIVDDQGKDAGKPRNPVATSLYHSMCKPGTQQGVHGDAVIAWDEDFK